MNAKCRSLVESNISIEDVSKFRESDVLLVPILNVDGIIVKILDLRKQLSVIPASVLIMAGGKGERLRPLTDLVPKPMLRIGNKPIIEHNIDRLANFGITEHFISVKYLANQIEEYFGDGSNKDISISYIHEEKPLGTLGALALIDEINNEHLLVMNSDILTNIDYEDLFKFYIESEADLCIVSIPYKVKVPYAVLETNENNIVSFKEKPTYTYYSNGGIYFMKSELKNVIPYNSFYNATDLMEELIKQGKKVIHYPLLSYWLDIGRHEDFSRAQEDIKHIKI
ncbi:D-glycero-alpha-D-manno-heptose 1-phosphate guanylyltransferase [compost metagenome]